MYFKYLNPVLNIQNGPLLVTNVVITPLLGGYFTPVTHLFLAIYRGEITPFMTMVGAHLLPSFQSSENVTLGTRHALQAHATSKNIRKDSAFKVALFAQR